jgi:two-component system alkaline phosphatase synthesis response regulator PhoP
MKTMLVKLGYDPECARNGKEAFEILSREEFPLILLDLILPEIGGIEVCMRIKERKAETIIYAFSAVVTEVDYYQLKKVGFDGFLCKLVSSEVLERAIKGAFEEISNRWKNNAISLCGS